MSRLPGAIIVAALIALLPLAAGCSAPAAPPAQAAAPTPSATAAPATVLPAVTASAAPSTPLTTTIAPTVPVTATATPAGTATPRPLPTGTPPADPLDVLNVFDVAPPGNIIIKRDILPLDGKESGKPDNVLVTLTGSRMDPSTPLTNENGSAIGVMTYDPVYREWGLTWQSDPISGTARPLPAANQFGGTNGGDLLRDGSSILMLRTTTIDGAAHLALFRYDSSAHKATALKMVPDAGAAEKIAVFDADLDVTLADLDDDGVYEVVADNASGVKTWRWDGSKYVPREAR